MSLQVNNNAVMGKEPCWGRGLIIKQLGNLFSIVHVALVASGAAGRGNFQNAVAVPRKTRRKFNIWSGDGDTSAATPSGAGPLKPQADVTALGERGKQKKSPYSYPGD